MINLTNAIRDLPPVPVAETVRQRFIAVIRELTEQGHLPRDGQWHVGAR